MAIVNLDEDLSIVEPNKGSNDIIPPKEFKNIDETGVSLLYNKETPLDTIIGSLSGYRWTVTYYNQLRMKNDTLIQFDVTASSTIQKYNRITNMLLYVQTPLSLDSAKELKGDALIRGDFLPNVHDVFLGSLPGGRTVLFTVKNVENRTANLNKVYYIEYTVLHYIDGKSNIGIVNNLNYKVVKKYVYDLNHLATRSSPLLLESTYKTKIDIVDAYGDILKYYLKHFLSRSRGLLSLPSKCDEVWSDLFITDFLLKTVNTSKYIEVHRLNRTPDNFYIEKPYTIFDILLNRRINDLKMVDRKIGFTDNMVSLYNPIVKLFNNKHGVRYIRNKLEENEIPYTLTDIKNISTFDKYFNNNDNIMPLSLDKKENIDPDFTYPTEPVDPGFNHPSSDVDPDFNHPGPIDPDFSYPNDSDHEHDSNVDEGFNVETEYWPPVLEENREYIFSKWFYSLDREKCGYIEKMVIDYLEGKPIDSKEIVIACQQYHMWSTEEQFDLIPILLFLINYYLNSVERL